MEQHRSHPSFSAFYFIPGPAKQPTMSSQVHQNYDPESEADVNRLVTQLLHTSYTYLSPWAIFIQDDVALPKFTSFLQHMSEEKHKQAEKLLTFQNHCGRSAILLDAKKPEQDEWGNRPFPMLFALKLEKSVNQAMLDLQQIDSRYLDPHMCYFLKIHYLDKEVKLIKKLWYHVSNLKRVRCAPARTVWARTSSDLPDEET